MRQRLGKRAAPRGRPYYLWQQLMSPLGSNRDFAAELGSASERHMRQLILMRHAKAATGSETGEDFDRPLAQRGRDDAPFVAKALAGAGSNPQVVLVSAARRTRETWELAAPHFKPDSVHFLENLYLAEADILLRAAQEAGAERVMVIAHNPGMHELASRLAHRMNALESRVRAKFPTAAAALFERKDDQTSWRLVEYVTPKDATD